MPLEINLKQILKQLAETKKLVRKLKKSSTATSSKTEGDNTKKKKGGENKERWDKKRANWWSESIRSREKYQFKF